VTGFVDAILGQDVSAYIAAGAAAVLLAAVVLRVFLRRRPSPEELERRRRTAINNVGKMADGTVLDVGETTISYSYDLGGVGYSTTQDISMLQDRLPPDRYSVAGPVAVKFDPRNPANSIVVCEEWSGLRHPDHIPKGA
jgi:hypothetical protein